MPATYKSANWRLLLAAAVLCALGARPARADYWIGGISDITANNYSVVFFGTNGANLSITYGTTINGSIAVDGVNSSSSTSGKVTLGTAGQAPSRVNGNVNFYTSYGTGLYTVAGAGTTPAAANYSVAQIPADVSTLTSDATYYNTEISKISRNTLVGNSATLTACTNSTSYCYYDSASGISFFKTADAAMGGTITITGNGSSKIVIDATANNFSFGANTNIVLNGVRWDQVVWNFSGSGTVNLNDTSHTIQGSILAPTEAISMASNTALYGRILGGAAGITIGSGARILSPEPAPAITALCGLIALGLSRRRSKRKG